MEIALRTTARALARAIEVDEPSAQRARVAAIEDFGYELAEESIEDIDYNMENDDEI